MSSQTIRIAYSNWPRYQAALRDVVAGLTEEQLAIQPTPDRWPLWATIGHLACQRVSGLCGTFDMLEEEIVRDFDGDIWRQTRANAIQRWFAHDLTHIAEINEILSRAGLRQVDLWS